MSTNTVGQTVTEEDRRLTRRRAPCWLCGPKRPTWTVNDSGLCDRHEHLYPERVIR